MIPVRCPELCRSDLSLPSQLMQSKQKISQPRSSFIKTLCRLYYLRGVSFQFSGPSVETVKLWVAGEVTSNALSNKFQLSPGLILPVRRNLIFGNLTNIIIILLRFNQSTTIIVRDVWKNKNCCAIHCRWLTAQSLSAASITTDFCGCFQVAIGNR